MPITLGSLTDTLEEMPWGRLIKFDTGAHPGSLDSWRGRYDELTLLSQYDDPCTVGDLLDSLILAPHVTFTGYKGGEFKMTRDTPVWADHYGENVGRAIIGVRIEDGVVILVTRMEDPYS